MGFSNKWHKKGVKKAIDYKINKNQSIKIFPVSIFIASKIEAFEHRGAVDYRTSHDIEDIITILNGHSKILESIATSDTDVRNYLKLKFSDLLKLPSFSEIIYGHLPSSDKNIAVYIEEIIKNIVIL